MTLTPLIAATNLPFPLFRRGKVRDVYDIGSYLLFVTTDRISAFDHILPDPIPGKGRLLNTISEFWFKKTRRIIPNHMLTATIADFPHELLPFSTELAGRSMVVVKTNPIDIECVIRKYLAGSAWEEYQVSGSVAGIQLPPGLSFGECLPTPLFTPAIKNHEGHDENISFEKLIEIEGIDTATRLKNASLDLFNAAEEWVNDRGLILADTKFEFGRLNNALLLIDEVLTPDSSRYWEKSSYIPGEIPPSFDKQIIRDYLKSVWKEPETMPSLPTDIIEKVIEKYREGYLRITGADTLP